MDPQKAYDTVELSALEGTLCEIGFPRHYVDWVMLGVTTVSYRYVVNGCQTRFPKARRGIRQGDPINPFLFVLIMEYLHRCLIKPSQPNFNFHLKCERLCLENLCFVDDLLVFTKDDVISV